MNEELQSTQEVSTNTNPVEQPASEPTPAQEQVGKRYEGEIIVNNINVMQYNARNIPEELLDKMTEEQLNNFIIGFNEEDKKYVKAKFGYVESHMMTAEERAARQARRASMLAKLTSNTPIGRTTTPKPQSNEPLQVKTEQTGSIIFGKRD